jgi:hypothetical protein
MESSLVLVVASQLHESVGLIEGFRSAVQRGQQAGRLGLNITGFVESIECRRFEQVIAVSPDADLWILSEGAGQRLEVEAVSLEPGLPVHGHHSRLGSAQMACDFD